MKILLVDDSRTIRNMQKNVLCQLGHTDIMEAADGLEALKQIGDTRPDLVLIDGGRGQLNAALSVINEVGSAVPVASLAKENEEIFLPGRKEPLVLAKTSPALQLLQRLRDEAHRFAISYYARVHRQGAFASALDAIPGVGPKRRRALLRRFGSVRRIREASVDELAAATGMARSQAGRIKEYL